MRILHIVHTPRYSGAEILVRDLCRAHGRQGHEAAVCSFNPPAASFLPEIEAMEKNGTRMFLPPHPLRRLQRVAALRRCYLSFRPDVILGHSSLPALYGRAALPGTGHPCFVSVLHSGTMDDFSGLKAHLGERLLSRWNDAVVCIHPLSARNYVQRTGYKGEIRVIPNGIDIARFQAATQNRAVLRAAWGIGNKKIILQTGRILEIKQQLFSIESLLPLLRQRDDIEIWLAGGGEEDSYVAQIKSLIAQNAMADRIKMLGPRRDVPDLLAAADVFIMPSLIELQGIALLEALASGVPVVASDLDTLRFAGQKEGVALVPPENGAIFAAAVEKLLLRKPAVTPPAGIRYARDMSEYDISRTAESYLSLFAGRIADRTPHMQDLGNGVSA